MVINLGKKLFLICMTYIFLSFLYYDSLYNNPVAMKFGVLLGIGFLILWFLYGVKAKAGFINGLIIGSIGAVGGIFLASLSLLMLINSADGGPFFIIIPWSYPLIGLFEAIPDYGMINNYFGHISVALVIFLTGIGSWIGCLINRSNSKPFMSY